MRQGQSQLAASVGRAVSVVAEAWARSGHSRVRVQACEQGLLVVGRSQLPLGVSDACRLREGRAAPGAQDSRPLRPVTRQGLASSPGVSQAVRGCSEAASPPRRGPGRVHSDPRATRRPLSQVLRGPAQPGWCRGPQPGSHAHAALRRRLQGDIRVPHSAIRISRRGRHALLNLCLHAALTFTVFAGGINRTEYPTLCQAVSAVASFTLLQSDRVCRRSPRGARAVVGRSPLGLAREWPGPGPRAAPAALLSVRSPTESALRPGQLPPGPTVARSLEARCPGFKGRVAPSLSHGDRRGRSAGRGQLEPADADARTPNPAAGP